MSQRPLKYVRHCWYFWRMNRKCSDLALSRKKCWYGLDVQLTVKKKKKHGFI